ncbi:MAG: serine/threonine protein kinase [Deltaproteobacteria bacterium]|nr:serine/threonine protein kinase [Deltaproteobacteria bacterium]
MEPAARAVEGAASSALLRIGDVVADKYRVDAVIGRGGMSVVYLATHLELDQQVALKVLSAAALVLPEYVVRLRREARAVSHIRSEHVARVYDIGMAAGPAGEVPFLVMERLTGRDLATVLVHHGPLTLDFVVMGLLHACEALAEAHALGIVHRDLKPANLFLTESVDGSPCVKVLDFGISRMTRAGLSPLTDPGTVLGTPNYMAPEQMEASAKVDARSDIWALGAILYELLVGKPPYSGASLPQIFMRIMRSRAPKPSDHRGLPAAVDRIVARCLAVEPDHRYASVAELALALAPLGAPSAREHAARISRISRRCSPPPAGAHAPPPAGDDAPAASHVTPKGPRRDGWSAALDFLRSALLGDRT